MKENPCNNENTVGGKAPAAPWHIQLVEHSSENNSRLQSLIERLSLKVDELRGSTPVSQMTSDPRTDSGFEGNMRASQEETTELLSVLDDQIERLF